MRRTLEYKDGIDGKWRVVFHLSEDRILSFCTNASLQLEQRHLEPVEAMLRLHVIDNDVDEMMTRLRREVAYHNARKSNLPKWQLRRT